jgi:hypothetical protein
MQAQRRHPTRNRADAADRPGRRRWPAPHRRST